MAKRYDRLIELARAAQPRVIVEIGVHRAMRAVRMCEAVNGPVHYIGFDVFDTKGHEFQEAALNGKGQATETAARRRLESLKRRKRDFTYELVVGDTRDTLHGREVTCDFAFIDGDHRVEAILRDYLAVRSAPVVVFDDYFRGNTPDLSVYGANEVVDRIEDATVEILPEADECRHGGYSHLAVVRR